MNDTQDLSSTAAIASSLAAELCAELSKADTKLKAIRAQLADLEGNACTGREHWRDRDGTRKPKLYIVHGINRSCPIHGTPAQGRRIRTYIGSDEDAIRRAQEAVAAEEKRIALHRQAARLNHRIQAICTALYDALVDLNLLTKH